MWPFFGRFHVQENNLCLSSWLKESEFNIHAISPQKQV